jgi:hypothetical protein
MLESILVTAGLVKLAPAKYSAFKPFPLPQTVGAKAAIVALPPVVSL